MIMMMIIINIVFVGEYNKFMIKVGVMLMKGLMYGIILVRVFISVSINV